ncbi:uncharacterized protein BJ171DRAFT_489299 [Polychytrium aggregatum]|uniref:uncharacterized protein n=1 Tax=Polychytrium aggregatum TaxID=110093 RepID=UPI0022FF30F9|nr:uncharacterized protein BJ171DRAFT_489299 [Polychytrium aggregatum]KAI9208545.1 hypothetical protein BJ171DRAFT_489299 [Polychytrium aggregatum]
MPQSVTLQDPTPLSPHPFSVSFPKKSSKAAKASPPPLPLVSCVPDVDLASADRAGDIAIVTVQGGGVYLYDIASQECLNSWSVPPGLTFSCPALFLSKAPAASENVEADNRLDADIDPTVDSTDAHEVAVESLGRRASGHIFAAIESTTKPQDKPGQLIWSWRIDAASTQEISREPQFSKQVPHPVYSLSPISGPATSCILVVSRTGDLAIYPQDLSNPLAELAPRSSVGRSSSVIWSSLQPDSHEKWPKSLAVALRHTAEAQKTVYSVRFIEIASKAGRFSFHLTDEVEVPSLPNYAHPTAFAYQNSESRVISIAYTNGIIKLFQLESNGLVEKLCLSLASSSPLKKFDDNLFRSIDITALDKSYLAVSFIQQDTLDALVHVYDAQFGTCQAQMVVQSLSEPADNIKGRSLHLSTLSSTLSGPILALTATTVFKSDVFKFTASSFTLPYYCPKLDLLSALGKARAQGTILPAGETGFSPLGLVGVVDTPNLASQSELSFASDSAFISALQKPKGWKDGQLVEFENLVGGWLGSKLPSKPAQKTDISAFEYVDISQPLQVALVNTCFEDPASFWPRKVLKYLLKNGIVTNAMNDSETSYMRKALLKGDLEIVALILQHVVDLKERDVVLAVRYICGDTDQFDIPMDKRLKQLKDAFSVHRHPVFTKNYFEAESSEIECDLTVPQRYFLELCFAVPRNDHHFTVALRQLQVNQVELLLRWVGSVLVVGSERVEPDSVIELAAESKETEARKSKSTKVALLEQGRQIPSEWLWDDEGSARYQKITKALDTLTLLLDAHLPVVMLTPELHPLLSTVGSAVSNATLLLSILERRLKGALLPFHQEEERAKRALVREKIRQERLRKEQAHIRSGGQQGGKRWRRMVADVEGAGKYRVEVFKI